MMIQYENVFALLQERLTLKTTTTKHQGTSIPQPKLWRIMWSREHFGKRSHRWRCDVQTQTSQTVNFNKNATLAVF